MNEIAQKNKHYIALEFDKVLSNLSKFANSNLAKIVCQNLEVFDLPLQIEYSLDLTTNAKKIIEDSQANLPIHEIADVEKIFKNKTFLASEIIELAKNLQTSRLTKNYISKFEFANLLNIAGNLYTDKGFEDEIFSIFDSDLNIKDNASEKLKSLRISYRDNKENLRVAINNLLQNNSFAENLQDTVVSTRDDRPVFQVKASCKNKISGIVHDVSSTNLTYFIEPAILVPYSNKLRSIDIEIKAEIERILALLTEKFKSIYPQLLENQKILTVLDVIFAKAKYSRYLKASCAELSKEKIIDIQAMRHPLLVDVKDEIVENDFIMGENSKNQCGIVLITGSNTGGKTVALKTVGLLILMTKAGLHIPCLGAKIFPYKEIFCDISTEQSLEQGFSTFSAHIKNIADILDKITSDSLVLLDELGSGTDPSEGASLSRAILEYIASIGANAIITTHLGELKTLKYKNPYFENATVLFDVESLKPLYKLVFGISGTSNAIDISLQLGLKSEIVENSRKYLLEGGSNSLKMFNEIEKTNVELLKKEKEIEHNLQITNKTKVEYDEKLSEFKKNKKKSLDNFKKKFQNQLDDARNEIKDIVDEIRKEKSIKVALRSYNRLNKLENAIREEFSKNEDEIADKYQSLDVSELKIGQNVLIKKLNQVVILDSLPDKKGFVTVKIGNIKSKVKLEDLAKTDKKVAPHLKKIQVSFNHDDGLLSRIDLRGMRVIDAIEYLDEKLDKASLRGLGQITVIHGLGTGALKSAVNDYLKNSPYVAKFRYGDATEGKDGVVIVDLL